MTPRRTIYYHDPLRDDFAGTHLKARPLGENFPYIHPSRVWRAASGLAWAALLPAVWLGNHVWFGVRVRNRRAPRGLKTGVFLYGNHTQAFPNATMPTLLAFPRRAYVLASPDALSIPLISRLVQMLGAMPVPDTLAGHRPFLRALETRAAEGALIAVYPEAHIWPYYTGVRPFSDASFAYPVRFGCPVVACAVTYRRRLLPFLPPALTLTLSDPILPNPDAAPGEERRRLRDQVYRFLCQQAERNQVRYYDYVQAG